MAAQPFDSRAIRLDQTSDEARQALVTLANLLVAQNSETGSGVYVRELKSVVERLVVGCMLEGDRIDLPALATGFAHLVDAAVVVARFGLQFPIADGHDLQYVLVELERDLESVRARLRAGGGDADA